MKDRPFQIAEKHWHPLAAPELDGLALGNLCAIPCIMLIFRPAAITRAPHAEATSTGAPPNSLVTGTKYEVDATQPPWADSCLARHGKSTRQSRDRPFGSIDLYLPSLVTLGTCWQLTSSKWYVLRIRRALQLWFVAVPQWKKAK
jgi:hypothetical protein